MPQDNRRTLPVVGLGASAGGIAALQAFFGRMPADSGMAFVVIMHLDPTHVSHLAEVLGHHTAMPVVDAEDGMPVEPDRVHVIPPNAKLSLDDGRFRLEQIDRRRAERRPVDHLFVSMAGQCGDRAIAVILSGSGSNGSAGIGRIKEHGGLVAVQDPATAEHAGMPSHAIGTGLADIVLPPDGLADAVVDYVRNNRTLRKAVPPESQEPDRFDELMTMLRVRTGHEFRCYKDATVLRRIRRRMALRQADTLDAYIALVRDEPHELHTLARELMINVTSFFRDGEAWEALREKAIAPLIAGHDPEEALRIWVPGCASGEEAYSLAMLVLEEAEKAGKPLSPTIFATDASEDALSIGRLGVYPASVVEELSQDRIDRFFIRQDDTFRVLPRLRDAVTFAPQNLLQDPPFSRQHLVSCRNVLIYLKPEFQQKIVALFHFALRQGGYLFLGNVETAVGPDLPFEDVSKRWRIYRRTGPTRHDLVDFPLIGRGRTPEGIKGPSPPLRRQDPTDLARRALSDQFAPPSVLIDDQFRVLYFHGETRPFLKHPDGEPTSNLMRLLGDGLQVPVRDAVQAARDSGRRQTADASMAGAPGHCPVRVTASPVGAAEAGSVLVSFERTARNGSAAQEAAPAAAPAAEPAGAADRPAGTLRLEEDLATTRERLRLTVRELEASNEDLKASNEETTSMNEELQSANEELESSKEELQSLNEELNTVNAQLQTKLQELENKTNDLNNLMRSSAIVTLFLDSRLRILWISPTTCDLFYFTGTDIGRSVTEFAQRFDDPPFMADARSVLDDHQPRENEVLAASGRWFLRQTLPYRTEDDRIAGVVVTFVEVTARKRAEQAVRVSEERFRALVAASAQMVWTTNADGLVVEDSLSWRAFTGQTVEERLGWGWLAVVHSEDRDQARQWWQTAVAERRPLETEFRIWHAPEKMWRHASVRVVPLFDADGSVREWVGMNIDITKQRRHEMLVGELRHRMQNTINTIQAMAVQTVRSVGSLEDFQMTFGERVQALARCHDMLVETGWRSARLGSILEEALKPHLRERHDRLIDDCADLELPAGAALGLTLTLHELATNAVKYGALSAADGRVEVRCARLGDDNNRIGITWVERGGPKAEAPQAKGFGMKLIEGTVCHELDGEVVFDFRADGLRVEASFPLP